MLYKINNSSLIYHGDCLDIMPTLDEKSVDLILTDPPYGTTRNKWDSVIPLSSIWSCINPIIKPSGVVALTSLGVFTADLILSNKKYFKYKIVWEKSKVTNFLNVHKQPLRKYEDICIFYNKQPTYNPQMSPGKPYDKGIRKNQTDCYGHMNPNHGKSINGDRYPTDIIYFKTAESEQADSTVHPTQKPVALMEYLIKTYTNPRDTVLDFTMGSGTTGVACANTGRKFIGIEIDSNYFNIAKSRIEQAYQNKEAA